MRPPCVHSLLLLILLLTTHVKSREHCSESNVSGAVGGAVTLQITHVGNGKLFWSFGDKGDIIASRRPGGELEIEEERYKGKLLSSSDGSLTITDLQHGDRGTYRAQIKNINQSCEYYLSVFSNLTAEDLTITSNVTYNETCDVILMCSVTSAKRSHVTSITWRSLNSSDISPTSSMTVPPNTINFTYICTANNPVSEVSKSVIPREYCGKDVPAWKRDTRGIYISIVVVVIISIGGIVIFFVLVKLRCKNGKDTKKSNGDERRGAECAPVLDDTEQKQKKIRQKKNGEQQPSASGVTSVYDQVRPVPATEPPGSPTNETTGCTLYSTVQHVKGRNGRKPAPPAPNGKVVNPPLESCYAQVKDNVKIQPKSPNKRPPQKPPHVPLGPSKDKNNQKASPDGANGNVQKTPEETFYEEVPHCEGGAKREPTKAAVESLYSQVTLPKPTEPAMDSVHYSVRRS